MKQNKSFRTMLFTLIFQLLFIGQVALADSAERAQATGSGVGERVGKTVDAAVDKVKGWWDNLDVGNLVKKAGEYVDKAGEGVAKAGEVVKETSEKAYEKVQDAWNDFDGEETLDEAKKKAREMFGIQDSQSTMQEAGATKQAEVVDAAPVPVDELEQAIADIEKATEKADRERAERAEKEKAQSNQTPLMTAQEEPKTPQVQEAPRPKQEVIVQEEVVQNKPVAVPPPAIIKPQPAIVQLPKIEEAKVEVKRPVLLESSEDFKFRVAAFGTHNDLARVADSMKPIEIDSVEFKKLLKSKNKYMVTLIGLPQHPRGYRLVFINSEGLVEAVAHDPNGAYAKYEFYPDTLAPRWPLQLADGIVVSGSGSGVISIKSNRDVKNINVGLPILQGPILLSNGTLAVATEAKRKDPSDSLSGDVVVFDVEGKVRFKIPYLRDGTPTQSKVHPVEISPGLLMIQEESGAYYKTKFVNLKGELVNSISMLGPNGRVLKLKNGFFAIVGRELDNKELQSGRSSAFLLIVSPVGKIVGRFTDINYDYWEFDSFMEYADGTIGIDAFDKYYILQMTP